MPQYGNFESPIAVAIRMLSISGDTAERCPHESTAIINRDELTLGIIIASV